MFKINQNQVRGLVDTLSSLQSQITNLDYFSTTGGTISGDVTIQDANLIVQGKINVSGDPFYLNSGNGTFGINIASPSGNIHIFSTSENVSIWLETNADGASPNAYPSIKFLNSGSGVSTEMGIISPSTLPFTDASGNAFFINHGASLVQDESAQNRVIQLAVQGEPVVELFTGKVSVLGHLDINSTRFSTISKSISLGETTLDTVNMSDYKGASYNLGIFNATGSRAEEFLMTWNSDTTSLNYTGIASPSVNNTSHITITGLKSGTLALLRASSAGDSFSVVGIANYLF